MKPKRQIIFRTVSDQQFAQLSALVKDAAVATETRIALRKQVMEILVGWEAALRTYVNAWPATQPDNFLIKHFPCPINFFRRRGFKSALVMAHQLTPLLNCDDTVCQQGLRASVAFVYAPSNSMPERRAALHNLQQALARIIEAVPKGPKDSLCE